MSNIWKVVLILLGIGLIAAVAGYFYVFHKPHRDIAAEKPEVELTAPELMDHYNSSLEDANARYLDKVLQVEGVVEEITTGGLRLEEGVLCTMEKDYQSKRVQEGDLVNVKGRVVGYDELFGEVKMDNCRLVEK